ncbi:hypothetical protein Ciccas_010568, partial [Cichlidogyrus casuarinus]
VAPTKKVHVGNLPTAIDEETVKQYFAPLRTIAALGVQSRQSSASAWVEFQEVVDTAIFSGRHPIGERAAFVKRFIEPGYSQTNPPQYALPCIHPLQLVTKKEDNLNPPIEAQLEEQLIIDDGMSVDHEEEVQSEIQSSTLEGLSLLTRFQRTAKKADYSLRERIHRLTSDNKLNWPTLKSSITSMLLPDPVEMMIQDFHEVARDDLAPSEKIRMEFSEGYLWHFYNQRPWMFLIPLANPPDLNRVYLRRFLNGFNQQILLWTILIHIESDQLTFLFNAASSCTCNSFNLKCVWRSLSGAHSRE